MCSNAHFFLHDELLLLELSELCYADKLNYTLFIFLILPLVPFLRPLSF